MAVNLNDFIRIHIVDRLADLDKLTFLYIRNGERLYRMRTAIEFGPKLFPDMDRAALDGDVYAQYFTSVKELVSRGDLEAAIERHVKNKSNPSRKRSVAAIWKALDSGELVRLDFYEYVKWTPASVYYDDVTRKVEAEIAAHNRIVTILQGLLDRSPVLHPHPPWQLWTPDGFAAAVELIYDDSRALVAGPKPDFEAYRARLNAALKAGSVTVGQEDYWERREAERENKRSGWRSNWHDLTRYRPYGNLGPGLLARAVRISKAACQYRWTRDRARHHYYANNGPITCPLEVPRAEVFNVDAYTPGDFKQFYADPRTRAEYLQWAPLLLAAEDFHAGKLLVDRDVDNSTKEGARRKGSR